MAPPTKSTPRQVFKTSSPFTATKGPQISQNDQEIILELVCDLITPLGEHRRKSAAKKRKRKNSQAGQSEPTAGDECLPAQPEIGKHILVGLNNVTRHLEALAAGNAPSTMPVAHINGNVKVPSVPPEQNEETRPLSIVVLTHPEPSLSPAYAHLPTLVHLSTLTASGGSQSKSPLPFPSETRLIPLATTTESRLASTLQIPRVGALAVFQGAPGAKPLEAFVRENVPEIECPWIDEALKAEWKGLATNVNEPGKKI